MNSLYNIYVTLPGGVPVMVHIGFHVNNMAFNYQRGVSFNLVESTVFMLCQYQNNTPLLRKIIDERKA